MLAGCFGMHHEAVGILLESHLYDQAVALAVSSGHTEWIVSMILPSMADREKMWIDWAEEGATAFEETFQQWKRIHGAKPVTSSGGAEKGGDRGVDDGSDLSGAASSNGRDRCADHREQGKASKSRKPQRSLEAQEAALLAALREHSCTAEAQREFSIRFHGARTAPTHRHIDVVLCAVAQKRSG